MTELEVRSHLAKLGFRGETVFKPCEALSGGELARLRFAEIVLERPNLLFLDEPTNHLGHLHPREPDRGADGLHRHPAAGHP